MFVRKLVEKNDCLYNLGGPKDVLSKSFSEEVLKESVSMRVDDNGLGVTEYGGMIDGSSGELSSEVGFILMVDVGVVFI